MAEYEKCVLQLERLKISNYTLFFLGKTYQNASMKFSVIFSGG